MQTAIKHNIGVQWCSGTITLPLQQGHQVTRENQRGRGFDIHPKFRCHWHAVVFATYWGESLANGLYIDDAGDSAAVYTGGGAFRLHLALLGSHGTSHRRYLEMLSGVRKVMAGHEPMN
jgi:hypothetical protein